MTCDCKEYFIVNDEIKLFQTIVTIPSSTVHLTHIIFPIMGKKNPIKQLSFDKCY